ncbi:MAG TPA: acetyl-CoA carboxylase biotin carboxyl carrier protein subunit [Nitrososphaeraceae archaeon]|nr:acetyl-CoA carboxylase biotin carboxyl carrier protein subunit [Nitrososphaeraceae archaeon]
MEFKIDNSDNILSGSINEYSGNGKMVATINGKEHSIKIVGLKNSILEFILDNSYKTAKILEFGSSHIKLLMNGEQIILKKHSKLTEILEKSMALGGSSSGENKLLSQIPGRVVSIMVKAGDQIKKGDSVIVLESMKMQVAVKAHKDGQVRDTKVKIGDTVSRNDIVAVIE